MNAKSGKIGKAIAVFCGAVMFLATSGVACFGAESTPNALDEVWGKPVAVTQTINGAEKRFYNMPDTFKAMGVNYRFFVVKNGAVISDGTTGSLDRGTELRKALAALPLQKLALSKAYYDKYPTTVAQIDQVWGKPADVKKLDNGMEERFYKTGIDDQKTQFRVFICNGDRVVASGLTFLSDGKASNGPINLIGLAPLNVYRGTESSYH